jgi:hypothetical protein
MWLNKLKSVWFEWALIALFAALMLRFFSSQQGFIHADAHGYYDYLPSIFLHQDIQRNDKPRNLSPQAYERVDQNYSYVNLENYRINKYACGTAFFVLPFYLPTQVVRQLAGFSDTGYEFPYQVSVLLAALFWLWVGLLALKHTLLCLQVKQVTIRFLQTAIVFATPFTHYAWFDAGFSHVYSFAAIAIFCYLCICFSNTHQTKYLLLLGLTFGVIIALRPINFLVILALPLLLVEPNKIGQFFLAIFKQWKMLLLSIGLFSFILFIQCYLWYLQCGKWLVYSYQGESFDFQNPQLLNAWFSYQKGLFIYTPFLLLPLFFVCYFGFKKKPFFASYYLLFLLGLGYVLSSWWSWFYGGSYGQRVYLDYLPILVLPIALLSESFSKKLQYIVSAVLLLCIGLNLIQTWQHQEYILHWDQMNKEKYWKVFLRTSKPYKGWVWKQKSGAPEGDSKSLLPSLTYAATSAKEDTVFCLTQNQILSLKNGKELWIGLKHHFPHGLKTEVALFAKDTLNNKIHFWEQRHLLHFCNGQPNNYQLGDCWFTIPPFNPNPSTKLYFIAYNLPKNDTLHQIQVLITK